MLDSRRAFDQVSYGSNIQLLSYSLSFALSGIHVAVTSQVSSASMSCRLRG
jgi:hypothetical protein